MNRHKKYLVRLSELIKLPEFGYKLCELFLGNNYIRSVNYHCTPPVFKAQFEQHLKYFHDHYSNVTEDELTKFLNGEVWNKSKPGLIISFDDGFRSNYDFAAPLLEKYGFTGWFMVPTGFIQVDEKHQKAYAIEHSMRCKTDYKERIAMSWVELRDLLFRGHQVCAHTHEHVRMPTSQNPDSVDFEVRESKKILEQRLGVPIFSFAWVGGEEENYSVYASDAIRDAGYSLSFNSNAGIILNRTNAFSLGRINIESEYSLETVRFQLSGFMDLFYQLKRSRINKILSKFRG
tara:strand:+ start:12226 stop:13095 length:870 start_codon:yes stop_codon:yes gene_type:complete